MDGNIETAQEAILAQIKSVEWDLKYHREKIKTAEALEYGLKKSLILLIGEGNKHVS